MKFDQYVTVFIADHDFLAAKIEERADGREILSVSHAPSSEHPGFFSVVLISRNWPS